MEDLLQALQAEPRLRPIGQFVTTQMERQPPTPAALQHISAILRYLREWQLPLETRAAALFVPWAVDGAPAWQKACDARLGLTVQLVTEWRTFFAPEVLEHDAYARAARSLKLRRLIRVAWINLPLALLTLAEHAARVDLAYYDARGAANKPHLWEDTEEIFIPLLYVLGIWKLRPDWLEACAQHLHLHEYVEYEHALRRIHSEDSAFMTALRDRIASHAGKDHSWQITVRPNRASTVFYRHREGEPLNELLTRLTMDIITDDDADCYRALALAHQLGAPVNDRFRDYIAGPSANGYRALHTAVVVSRKAVGNWPGNRLVEFRIRSQAMQRLNQGGIVAACFQEPDAHAKVRAWWNRSDEFAEAIKLMKSRDIGEHAQDNDTQIYVFTPRGEIRLMKVGSTALDFAYSLHTQIGHHCRAVYLNEQPATHATELHNGDLVRLERDPYFPGPDPAWLHITQNPLTRAKIKRGLGAINQAVHPGRQLILKALQKVERESGFVLPPSRLDKHLDQAAQALRLGHVSNLYEALGHKTADSGGRVQVDWIISYILERELASAVVTADGQPVLATEASYQPGLKLNFCRSCKPLPGKPILLHRRFKRGRLRLTLHRGPLPPPDVLQPEQICLRNIPRTELDDNVQWREIPSPRRLTNLTVIAKDRPRLLGEVLEVIYCDDRLTLTHVEANADSEGTADMWFTVEHNDPTDILRLWQQIPTQVPDIINIAAWPTGVVTHAIASRRWANVANPYSSGDPVYDQRMFFGREVEITHLRDALDPRRPTMLITVYGQRRVGKTSLALHLIHALRSLPLRAVYIDLLRVRHDLSPSSVCREIAESVQRVLFGKLEVDHPLLQGLDFAQEPQRAFREYLLQVQKQILPQRLLLMLDEFNVLVEECRDRSFFSFLRSLIQPELSGISWLIITHAAQFRELDKAHPAQQVYGQGWSFELPSLDDIAARKLVKEPLRGYLDYADEVVTQIVTHTGRNTYLMNILCYILVKDMREQERNYARIDDLLRAEQEMLKQGETYFAFLTERLKRPEAWRLLGALARCQTGWGEWASVSETARSVHLPPHKVVSLLRYLEQYGLVDVLEAEERKARYTIEYFRQWMLRREA